MTDTGGLTSSAANVNLTIELTNDESPEIVNTLATQTFVEGDGPVSILSANVTIRDADNCLKHTLIQSLDIELQNPVVPEDVLIYALSSNISYSCDMTEGSGYHDTFISCSCDMTVNVGCYDDLLRAVQYNNTNDEPNFEDRIITVTVSE